MSTPVLIPTNTTLSQSAKANATATPPADFFAPVFESALNRAVFVLTSLLVETAGNLCLYLLQAYVASEANAILCDRLVASLARIWFLCNVVVLPFKVSNMRAVYPQKCCVVR